MGTVVSIRLVGCSRASAEERTRRALAWFTHVENTCSRFIPDSELRRVCATVGTFVSLSDVLFELLQFSLASSAATDGAFDPTVGAAMVAHGFNREWKYGHRTTFGDTIPERGTWRDLELDINARALRLARPLLLDLGAVAKGLALDLAARDLADIGHFAIDAGGDVVVAGHNGDGLPWSVGIRHPRIPGQLLTTLQLSGCAVCTSGDYEKRTDDGDGHHLLDPRMASVSATGVISATVVAEHAMVADGLSTAAFVLGPHDGCEFLEREGVQGMLVASDGVRHFTSGMATYTVPVAMHV